MSTTFKIFYKVGDFCINFNERVDVAMDEKEVIRMLIDVVNTNIEMYKQREDTDRQTLETMRYMDDNHNRSIVRVALGVSLGFGVIIAIFLFCLAIS